jgi:hypothetical protein
VRQLTGGAHIRPAYLQRAIRPGGEHHTLRNLNMRKLFLAASAIGLIAASAASAQTFTFTTLDNPGDPTFNQLLGINDSGTIVGYFGSGAAGHPNIGYEIAAPYTKYTSNNQPGSVQTQATGINNSGLTTGFWSDTNTGTDANFAFLRTPVGRNFSYLSVINPLTASTPPVSQALGVNNSGVVAGFYNDANGLSHGYTYTIATAAYAAVNIPGAVADAATAINDNGQIAGFYVLSNKNNVGFVKNGNGGVVTHFTVPKTKFTQLLGINNSGVAVGDYMDAAGLAHGLYYTPATGAWLTVDHPAGVGGTVVNGINNKNQLVGFYTDAAGNVHGMLVNVTP